MYNNLTTLTHHSDAFYSTDVHVCNHDYRIFNYRFASYTEFLQSGALDCRGTMFELKKNNNVELISIGFEKFFNLYECPFTMDLNLQTVEEIANKVDGSLITSYMNGSQLMLKSKGSVISDQAVDSMNFLLLPENARFRNEIVGAERLGYTVIMEWIGPNNRIVLGYTTSELKVLGVRSRIDGSYVDFLDVDVDIFPEIIKRWTNLVVVEDPIAFVASIPDMSGIEGYVVRLASGQRVKIKTNWYMALHHTKDSITSPRRLFEAVIEETTDDMRSLFHDDAPAIELIDQMEQFVEVQYNSMVSQVEYFYHKNIQLDRKEYAILGQQELPKLLFGLAMNKYTRKVVNYKEFMKSKWKEFGLHDTNN